MDIPIRISPGFFIVAFFIALMMTSSVGGIFCWVLVIFLSILVHEYGHALFARYFGYNPAIDILPFGGITSYPNTKKIPLVREFIIILAGPLFGFMLFLFSNLLIEGSYVTSPPLVYFFDVTRRINLIWTLANLIPVLPLDGGQLLRVIFEAVFGFNGKRVATVLSMILAVGLGLTLLGFRFFILAIVLFLFAYQNFEMFRQIRMSSSDDDDVFLKSDLLKAEKLIAKDKLEEAKELLLSIIKRTKHGMIHSIALQEVAQILNQHEQYQSVYDLLKHETSTLSDGAKVHLQRAAFEVKDYTLALNLSGECLINLPDSKMILRAAAAAAMLGEEDAAIGWLKTAKDYGVKDLRTYLQKPFFDSIRSNQGFVDFTNTL